jgi:hypothetical protein
VELFAAELAMVSVRAVELENRLRLPSGRDRFPISVLLGIVLIGPINDYSSMATD